MNNLPMPRDCIQVLEKESMQDHFIPPLCKGRLGGVENAGSVTNLERVLKDMYERRSRPSTSPYPSLQRRGKEPCPLKKRNASSSKEGGENGIEEQIRLRNTQTKYGGNDEFSNPLYSRVMEIPSERE